MSENDTNSLISAKNDGDSSDDTTSITLLSYLGNIQKAGFRKIILHNFEKHNLNSYCF